MSETLTTLPVVYEAPDERRLWKKLARVIARIAFAEDLLAAWFCAMDRATPMQVKAVLWGAVAYFILPVDVVPDWLMGLGFTDDATVLTAAIAAVGSSILPAHRTAARERLDQLLS
ncbi:MAG: YkvA family protein [Geminicoccaceae bacterium]